MSRGKCAHGSVRRGFAAPAAFHARRTGAAQGGGGEDHAARPVAGSGCPSGHRRLSPPRIRMRTAARRRRFFPDHRTGAAQGGGGESPSRHSPRPRNRPLARSVRGTGAPSSAETGMQGAQPLPRGGFQRVGASSPHPLAPAGEAVCWATRASTRSSSRSTTGFEM